MNTAPITKQNGSVPERVSGRPTALPRCDVYENAEELLLFAEVPGVTRDHVSIDLDKGTLTIEATRDTSAPGTLLAGEARAMDYHRVFTVPQGIDGSRIEATLRGGVLRVKLPKSDSLKPRRIEVRAAS